MVNMFPLKKKWSFRTEPRFHEVGKSPYDIVITSTCDNKTTARDKCSTKQLDVLLNIALGVQIDQAINYHQCLY